MDSNLEVMAPATNALTVSPATPADMVLYAMQHGATIDQLREFMQMQREWEADQARKQFVADMAEFKKHPPQITKDKAVGYKNKDGSFTGYHHATLGNVTSAIVEGLAKHGFSHRWDIKQEGAMAHVTCTITHRMGHSESVSMQATKDDSGKKNQIQQIASAITYLQRYTLLAATGLATHDQDDDAESADVGTTDTGMADKWIAQAGGAKDRAALNTAWEQGHAALAQAGDKHGIEELRAACNARRASFPPAAPNTSSRLASIVGVGAPAE